MNNTHGVIGLVLVACLAIMVASAGAAGVKVTNTSPGSGALLPAPISPSQLGPTMTAAGATSSLGRAFALPTFLPASTSSPEIHATSGAVGIVYYNPSLPSLPGYTKGNILILILNDDTTYSFPSGSGQTVTRSVLVNGTTETFTTTIAPAFVPNYVSVSVAGNPGWAYGPVSNSIITESGRMEWWAGGLHYVLLAELPVASMNQIASSMFAS